MLLKEKHGDSVAWFGGGAYINHVDFKAKYEKVISLEGLGLHWIHSKDNILSIGASVSFQKLVENRMIPKPLRKAAKNAAPRTLRNLMSIGGDIGIGGASSKLIPVLVALGAQLKTASKHVIQLEQFIKQDTKELVLEIILPDKPNTCFVETITLKANGPIIATVAVSLAVSESGTPEDVIVCIGNIEDSSRRLDSIEEHIASQGASDSIKLEAAIKQELKSEDDFLGSSSFKNHITAVAISDCVARCMEQE